MSKTWNGQCQHPRLAPIAEYFLTKFETHDSVAAANSLGESSRGWKDARRRRQSLAARIALLSKYATDHVTGIVEPAVQPPPAVPNEPSHQSPPTTGEAPKTPRAKRTAPPAMNMREASSLFDALGSSEQSELSDPDAGEGKGFGFEFFAPEVPEKQHRQPSLAEPDGSTATGRMLREFPSEDVQKMAGANVSAAGASKPMATMADLSLAILTGDFVGTADAKETEEVSPLQQNPTEFREVEDPDKLSVNDLEGEAELPMPSVDATQNSKASQLASEFEALSSLLQSDDEIDDAEILEESKLSKD